MQLPGPAVVGGLTADHRGGAARRIGLRPDDRHLFAGALDDDFADGGERGTAVELLVDVLAKLEVFAKEVAIRVLRRVPLALVVFRDADAKAERIYLLTHV